jgi:CelD/BcsL family acetyltransferase involved in cellulose biosynthesis
MTEAHATARLEVGGPVGVDDLREAWAPLARASGRIFSTHEWSAAWWHTYGRDRVPRVMPLTNGNGALVGIVPIYIDRRFGLRIARFIGHGAGDELGPVCAPEDRPAVADALVRMLRSGVIGADVLLAEAVPAIEGWQDQLEATILHRVSSPTIVFATDDWEAYLATVSANLRGQLRQRERRLVRERKTVYRVTADERSLSSDLDTFFALHAARWGSASTLLARTDFYRRFCSVALERGWLRLSFLYIDDEPAASSLDFRYGDIQFHYNSGRDPRWDSHSAGLVLRAMTLRDALAEGTTEYRFLRGDEPYKARFATGDRGSLTFALPHSRLGRLSVSVAARLAASGTGRRMLRQAGTA